MVGEERDVLRVFDARVRRAPRRPGRTRSAGCRCPRTPRPRSARSGTARSSSCAPTPRPRNLWSSSSAIPSAEQQRSRATTVTVICTEVKTASRYARRVNTCLKLSSPANDFGGASGWALQFMNDITSVATKGSWVTRIMNTSAGSSGARRLHDSLSPLADLGCGPLARAQSCAAPARSATEVVLMPSTSTTSGAFPVGPVAQPRLPRAAGDAIPTARGRPGLARTSACRPPPAPASGRRPAPSRCSATRRSRC